MYRVEYVVIDMSVMRRCLILKVEVKGMVLEARTIKDDEGEVRGYEIMLFQSGERENVVIRSSSNGVSPGEFVRCKGRLSVSVWRGKPYVNVFADEINAIGDQDAGSSFGLNGA